jgi:hypothetical protein
VKEYKSLEPVDLPDGFDVAIHTEEPIVKMRESDGTIVVDYTFPGFYLVSGHREIEGEKFKHVKIASTGSLCESGKPSLPSLGRYVQIPHHCDYKVTISEGQPIPSVEVLAFPARTHSTGPDQKHEFKYDEDFYSTDILYPEDNITVSGPYDIDDYRALLVHVTPFRYNPAKRQLIGIGNVKISIELVPKNGPSDDFAAVPGDRERFGNLFLNPAPGIEERLGFPSCPVPTQSQGPELIIVYARPFEDAAKRLAKWKNTRGLLTEVVSVDTIEGTLKDYIRRRRGELNSRLRYLLLFGNADLIKPETINPSRYGSNITDYYYSTRFDPDRANPDSDLIFPWLSVGRIPLRPELCSSPADDAMGIVEKIIGYEKNPPTFPEYYKRMVFAAFFEDAQLAHQDDLEGIETFEHIRSRMESLGYLAERVYMSSAEPQLYKNGDPVPADVRNAIIPVEKEASVRTRLIDATTEGHLLICYRGHGKWSGWSHPPFEVSDLDRVDGNIPSVFFSLTCDTGMYDWPGQECFAEKNLKVKGAAPTLFAATRYSNNELNNDLMMALFDAAFGGVLSSPLKTIFPGSPTRIPVKHPTKLRRLGDILNYGKAFLPLARHAPPDYIKDHFEIYHVIGDPTLELWTQIPLTLDLDAKVTGNVLHVKLSTCPERCILTIWMVDKTSNLEDMLRQVEPSSKNVTVSFSTKETAMMASLCSKPLLRVCCWAPGYRYTETEVAIS